MLKRVGFTSVTMGNDTAKLSPTVMGDLIEKTTFTADEIHSFYREFEKGCAPGSLAMTREEFKVHVMLSYYNSSCSFCIFFWCYDYEQNINRQPVHAQMVS